MGTASASKCLLTVLNVLYTILGLALAAGSIWFFVEVQQFTNLRNSNHYLLDYKVYWPQAIPWMFFVCAIVVIGVSCCGFSGVKKNSRGIVVLYVAFLVIAIVLLLAAAVIALVFADNKATDDFVKDTVWDAYFQAKSDRDTESAFGRIEKKLHCCGADSPRDYKNWKNEFPQSCCDVYFHGFYDTYTLDCEFTNKLANERYGCSTVASQYARIFIKVLSGVSILTAFIGIMGLVSAVSLSRALRKKSRVVEQKNESDSKKVLL